MACRNALTGMSMILIHIRALRIFQRGMCRNALTGMSMILMFQPVFSSRRAYSRNALTGMSMILI